MDVVQVAELWEENQECLKQHLGRCDSDQFGARWVLMPTVPYPRFNHVSRIRVAEEQVPDLIQAARSFFRERGIPTLSFLTTPATRPGNLAYRLHRSGFASDTNPVLIWTGARLPPDPPRPDLRVERVNGPEGVEVFWAILRQVFFPGASRVVAAEGRRGVDISFAIGAYNYVAYLSGVPVGAGTLFIRNRMGGVYNMCTLPHHQRKGVAAAVLRRCVSDALASGCTHVGLTPTPMGRPLYERFGFQEAYQEVYLSQRIGMWETP